MGYINLKMGIFSWDTLYIALEIILSYVCYTFIAEIIKNLCDRELNLITQCIRDKNVLKCSPATVSNILLKINAKLDGVNNISFYNARIPSFAQVSLLQLA